MAEESAIKLCKSKTYVLPYINKYINIKFIDRLVNTYLFFNNDYAFCLRYKFSGKKEFTEYEKQLEKSKYYKETVDINKEEVLYVFDIPDELFTVVDLYTSGKYSYLPEKELIIEFLITNFNLTLDNKIIKILNRDKGLREEIEEKLNVRISEDMDLSSPPNLELENFIFKRDNNDEKEYIDKD